LAGSSEDYQLIYNHQNDESEQKFGKNLQSTENSRLNQSKRWMFLVFATTSRLYFFSSLEICAQTKMVV